MQDTSAVRRIYDGYAHSQISSTGASQQIALRTGGHAVHGFLKQQFLPLYEPSEYILPAKVKTERGFFKSLKRLCKVHSLRLPKVSDKAYPYNLLIALLDAEQQLSKQCDEVALTIKESSEGEVSIASTEAFDYYNKTFYLPVKPLFRLMQQAERKHCAALLCSVFAYLKQVARLPYFTESYYDYVSMIYQTLRDDPDAVYDMDDDQDIQQVRTELEEIQSIGEAIDKKISSKSNLKAFQSRLNKFSPLDDFEMDCLAIAQRFFMLYSSFPEQNIYSNIPVEEPLADEEEEDEDEDYREPEMQALTIDHFVSFTLTSSGPIHTALEGWLECDLQNSLQYLYPTIERDYSSERTSGGSLAFDYALYPLLEDLTDLLNTHDHE